MKVLVIGGTRLLGLSVVRRLLEAEHVVTVLSRRTGVCPATARQLGMDRQIGLKTMSGESFDIVVDFLAYDGAAVTEALVAVPAATYVLISSSWITRLQPGVSVDEPITTIDQTASESLLTRTRDYLSAKREAESALLAARQRGHIATVLRLPIFLGAGDHTGRIEFYRQRASAGGGMIAVDGGNNLAQIAWTEDLARSLVTWLPLASQHPIWDGLPDSGLAVRRIMELISRGTGRTPHVIDVPSAVLEQRLPEYLKHEPLWREAPLAPSMRNIFSATATVQTPCSQWLCGLRGAPDPSFAVLREQELTFIERLAV